MAHDWKLDLDIRAFYEQGDERDRLSTIHRLEFFRTCEILIRFLPPPPATILDVGGGAGAYALWLTEHGYEVELLDPIPLHVEQARSAGIARARLGDARDLGNATDSCDVVLLLGPLYHLVSRGDRLLALTEARRVVRREGLVVAAAISRFSPNFEGLRRGFLDDSRFEQLVERGIADGVHDNETHHKEWFTMAYLHRPAELREELRAAGLAVEALLAVEGPGALLASVDEWLDDPIRQERLLRAIRRVESEPSLLGATSHLIAVARHASPHA